MQMKTKMTGYPSIDKPWLKYYTEEARSTPFAECTMYELIYNNNQNNLSKTALEYYGARMTYAEMFKEISSLAGTLEKVGVKEGDIITVCMINSPETICLLFALNKIGAVANMVYGSSTQEELKKYILDTNSSLVFTLDIFQDKFIDIAGDIGLKNVVVTNLARSVPPEERSAMGELGVEHRPLPKDSHFICWDQFFGANNVSSVVCHNTDAPAIITYTGGTTGGSKGVLLQNKAVIAVIQQYILGEPGLKRESTWVLALPLFIAYGTAFSLMISLSLGMTLIVRIPLNESITELCEKFKPNHIMHGPAYWEKFADDKKNLDLSNMIAPFTGGDILRSSVELKINKYLQEQGCKYPIMNAYGITEAGTGVSSNFQYAHEIGSVGIPFVRTVISAFDIDTGKELRYRQEGEICIHTPSVMSGYVNNPEETNHILRLHEDGKIWVHSGDLGYVTEDGFVYISGRLKRYITHVHNGVHKKVFSLDIEKVLLTHPSVENCAVVPVANSETFQAPAAFIVLRKDFKKTQNIEFELRAHSAKKLPMEYQPIRYIFVDKFPLTKVGKVDYKVLEESV